MHSRNTFNALSSVFGFISDRIENQNLKIGNLVALDENVKLRIFYTPRILTTNSLVFDKEKNELLEARMMGACRKNNISF